MEDGQASVRPAGDVTQGGESSTQAVSNAQDQADFAAFVAAHMVLPIPPHPLKPPPTADAIPPTSPFDQVTSRAASPTRSPPNPLPEAVCSPPPFCW